MKILLGGGTGLVGTRLNNCLQALGHEITVISRKPSPSKKIITWNDIERNGIPSSTDVIINLSGRNIGDISLSQFTGKYNDFLKEVKSSRIYTSSLLSSLTDEKIKYYINASAVGIYESSRENVYDEFSSLEHKSYMSNLCAEWEKSVNVKSDKSRSFAFRIGVVIDKDSPVLKQLYLPFKLGFGGPVGDGNQWFPWIHMSDLLEIFKYTLEGKFDKVYDENKMRPFPVNCVAPSSIKYKEFTYAYGEVLNAPMKNVFHTPGFVISTLMGKERADLILEGPNVMPKVCTDNGFKFKYTDIKTALNNL